MGLQRGLAMIPPIGNEPTDRKCGRPGAKRSAGPRSATAPCGPRPEGLHPPRPSIARPGPSQWPVSVQDTARAARQGGGKKPEWWAECPDRNAVGNSAVASPWCKAPGNAGWGTRPGFSVGHCPAEIPAETASPDSPRTVTGIATRLRQRAVCRHSPAAHGRLSQGFRCGNRQRSQASHRRVTPGGRHTRRPTGPPLLPSGRPCPTTGQSTHPRTQPRPER